MQETVKRLHNLIAKYDEFRIQSFDSWQLVLLACWDLTYHHNVEVVFNDVSFLQCATDFRAQNFRLAKREECAHFLQQLDGDATVFCFDSDGTTYFVAAKTIEIEEKLVLHYAPE